VLYYVLKNGSNNKLGVLNFLHCYGFAEFNYFRFPRPLLLLQALWSMMSLGLFYDYLPLVLICDFRFHLDVSVQLQFLNLLSN
jgi:hypothetical protein